MLIKILHNYIIFFVDLKTKKLYFYTFYVICTKLGGLQLEIWGTSRDRMLKLISYSCSGKSKCIESTRRNHIFPPLLHVGGNTSTIPPTPYGISRDELNFKFFFGLSTVILPTFTLFLSLIGILCQKCTVCWQTPNLCIAIAPPPLRLQMSLIGHRMRNPMWNKSVYYNFSATINILDVIVEIHDNFAKPPHFT
jgi:hypothetical protein